MDIIEATLFEQIVYGENYFKYFIDVKSKQYSINIWNSVFPMDIVPGMEINLCIYNSGARVYPDFNTVLNLHHSLAYVLIKNIDIFEMDTYRRLMTMSLANFENKIKPHLKVVSTTKEKCVE